MGFIKTVFEDNKKLTTPFGAIVIFIFMIIIFWDMAGGDTMTDAEIRDFISGMSGGVSGKLDFSGYEKIDEGLNPMEDYASEGQSLEREITIAETNVINVTFRLTWKDEDDASMRHTNRPDTFSISVEGPDPSISFSTDGANAAGKEGLIEYTVNVLQKADPKELPFLNGTGNWKISITVDAGDQEPLVPSLIGLREFADGGNDFTLEISYEFMELI